MTKLLQEQSKPLKMLKLSEVKAKVRLSATTIYKKINSDQFPVPVKLGSGVRWFEHEVDEYLLNLPRTR